MVPGFTHWLNGMVSSGVKTTTYSDKTHMPAATDPAYVLTMFYTKIQGLQEVMHDGITGIV